MPFRSLICSEPSKMVVKVVPDLVLAPTEISVKVAAVALNPTDWKHRQFVIAPGQSLGCDFAGTVAAVGAKVNNVQVGEMVAGFVHGGRAIGVGSFAEYVKTEGSLVWKVPKDVSPESAAALGGIGPHTAWQALYTRHHLAHPSTPIKQGGDTFLVAGASSSVGMYAVQLARLSGYQVVATCSPKSFDKITSLGATAVFDYNDPNTPAAIKAAYPGLNKALDCIAEKDTTAKTALALTGPGKIVTLLPVPDSRLEGKDPSIEVQPTLVYTVIGKAFDFPGWAHFPAAPEDKAAMEKWLLYVPSIIESKQFLANPLLSQPGGLDGVDSAMDLHKSGVVSAQKITLRF